MEKRNFGTSSDINLISCCDCGKERTIDRFSKDLSKRNKKRPYCKECDRKKYRLYRKKILKARREYRLKNREKILNQKMRYYSKNRARIRSAARNKYISNRRAILDKNIRWRRESIQGRYMDCRRGAEKRGLLFEITKDRYMKIISSDCFYCGCAPGRTGVDRFDNSIGYIDENVVPSCMSCNRMKNDHVFFDFIGRITRLWSRWGSAPEIKTVKAALAWRNGVEQSPVVLT